MNSTNNKRVRINEQIRLSPIMLIGTNGENLGVKATHEALRIAREAGLDLVEVSPTTKPPVCRIMDYGKFKYEQSVKSKKTNKSKSAKLKEIQFRPSIAEHDLGVKINSISKFLEDGCKVQIRVQFKQRENAHRELGVVLVNKLIEALGDKINVSRPAKFEGKDLVCFIEPK